MTQHQGGIFLTPCELAERWQVPQSLLANWRYRKVGPNYLKIGHAVRYSIDAVRAFEQAQEGL